MTHAQRYQPQRTRAVRGALSEILGALAWAALLIGGPLAGGHVAGVLRVPPLVAWAAILGGPSAFLVRSAILARRERAWVTGVPMVAVGLATIAVLGPFGFMVYAHAVKEAYAARSRVCSGHVRRLAIALHSYQRAHEGRLPSSADWWINVRPYLETYYEPECPEAQVGNGHYALNGEVGHVLLNSIVDPDRTVLILEGDIASYEAGGPALLPDEPRHLGGDHYGFADGHVQWLPRKKLGMDTDGKPIWAKEPDADWVIWEPVVKDKQEEQHLP